MARRPAERHHVGRTGWLRAAVLGANDGILSTASLIVGVAAAHAARQDIVITGVAGLVLLNGLICHVLPQQSEIISTRPPPDFRPPRTIA